MTIPMNLTYAEAKLIKKGTSFILASKPSLGKIVQIKVEVKEVIANPHKCSRCGIILEELKYTSFHKPVCRDCKIICVKEAKAKQSETIRKKKENGWTPRSTDFGRMTPYSNDR